MSELLRVHLVVIGEASARPAGLEAALSQHGFQVDEAPPSGDAAAGRPDAALVCVAGGGPATVQRAQQLIAGLAWRDVPALVLTDGSDPSTVADLLRSGVGDAMGAPVHFEILRARLDRLLQSGQDVATIRSSLSARELLFDIFQEVASALRPEEIFHTLVRRVGQALGLSHCSFVLTDPDGRYGRVVAVYENPTVRDLKVDLARYPEIQEALRTERPVVVDNVKEHPLLAGAREKWTAQGIEVKVRSSVVLPVFLQGVPAGVFFLRTREGDAELSADAVTLAETIAQAAARVLEHEERRSAIYRRLLSATAIDDLTGCASAEALERRMRDEFERARRYRLRFCVVLFDLDGMREINQTLGLSAGDALLAEMGRLLQRELRAPDLAGRFGGDEFAVVLPETDARGGRNLAQRLAASLGRRELAELSGRRPGFAAGVASYPHPDVLRAEDLIGVAEAALLRAKASSADRIQVALSGAA